MKLVQVDEISVSWLRKYYYYITIARGWSGSTIRFGNIEGQKEIGKGVINKAWGIMVK